MRHFQVMDVVACIMFSAPFVYCAIASVLWLLGAPA